MRQKFDAEAPDEMEKNNEQADRSQGAARAISVRNLLPAITNSLTSCLNLVLH